MGCTWLSQLTGPHPPSCTPASVEPPPSLAPLCEPQPRRPSAASDATTKILQAGAS